MKFIALSCLLLFALLNIIHADPDKKARAFYFSAEDSYANKDYDEALLNITEAENILGGSNAVLEGLRVKVLYNQEKYEEALKSLNVFFGYYAIPDLEKEIFPYLRKIEQALELIKYNDTVEKLLYEYDKKYFSRKAIVNGKNVTATLLVSVSTNINNDTHEIHFDYSINDEEFDSSIQDRTKNVYTITISLREILNASNIDNNFSVRWHPKSFDEDGRLILESKVTNIILDKDGNEKTSFEFTYPKPQEFIFKGAMSNTQIDKLVTLLTEIAKYNQKHNK